MARRSLLSADEIAARLREVPGWSRSGNAIERTWTFRDFSEALAFINKVGGLTESISDHLEDKEDGHDLGQEAQDQGESPEDLEQREQDCEHGSPGPARSLHESDRFPHVLDLRPAMG